MKKIFATFLLISMFSMGLPIFAVETVNVEEPKWEDYVPDKYLDPRDDFSRGGAISEMIVGIVLTDLIITAPVGIPMIVHSSTKFKNISYSEKKEKFDDGLAVAKLIKDPVGKQEYYNTLLRSCKFTKSKKLKLARKRAKAAAKEARKAEKEAKKLEKAQKEIEKLNSK